MGIEYELIRSQRKSIALRITKEAHVEVRAPLKAPKADIDRFVDSKRDWISKHLSERKRQMQNKAAFELRFGDTLPFQGREYPITARDGKLAGFDEECFFLPPGLPQAQMKRAIIQVYKMLAKILLTNKAAEYADKTGLTPTAVKINGAKTRWGSCSGKNSLNFSWRLVMADDDVIDYVVVHELAHTREHNHSDRFWTLVAAVMPDYNERRRKLKALQDKLSMQEWDSS